ncbi:LamG-like jellyroll fold domain-containing protein [Christiangramia aquimixticola]|uniref:LamG-like jellyroll fold domain-containing protein n=1 Tax=Christiangramia aquimixticola TaxID=1697558 RepID=UPI003AA82643
MGIKLHGKFFLLLIFLPALVWGQCLTGPINSNATADVTLVGSNSICSDDSISITSDINLDGGTSPHYQWQVQVGNGSWTNITDENAEDLSNLENIVNNSRFRLVIAFCEGTGNEELYYSDTSSTITVNTNKTPTVNISSSPATKCIGETISFTATNTNGGSNPTYNWYVNGETSPSQSSNSNTFAISNLPSGDHSIRVELTSSLTCVTSSTVEETVGFTIIDNITITNPVNKDQNTVCINSAIDPIIFSLNNENNATVTGLPSGVTGNYSSGNLTISGLPNESGTFNYTVTATGSCDLATESGTITVVKDATISLSSGNTDQVVCQDDSISAITYIIGETGTGANDSGLPAGITGSFSNGIYTISGSSSVIGTHNFSIYATGTCEESAMLTGSITINEKLIPEVSITSSDSDDTICENEEVTFTASPTNGGSNPSYQWKVDGSDVGPNSATFTTSALTTGQSVTVEMTSNEDCLTQPTAISGPISTTVNPNLTPDVTIAASDSDICDGDEVTFTATPVNGGDTPSYQWKVDGNNEGSNSDTFITSSLTDGQSVTVVLTSNETCLTSNTATSEPIVATVNPNLTPEVTVTSNDSNNIICAGETITFTPTPVNGGSSPSYEWFLDGVSLGTGSTFPVSPGVGNHTVKVIMTSNDECLLINTAESDEMSFQVDQSVAGTTPTFDYSVPSHNSTAICPAANGLIYTINPIPGATSYIWTFPNAGWTVTSGEDTNQITLTAGVTATGGNITVRGVTECGQSEPTSLAVTTGTVAYVNAGPDQIVCAGTTTVQLAGEIDGVIKQGKDFSWDADVAGGSFSDQNGNNADKKLNPTYTIPPSIRDGGNVTITITSVSPSGTCPEPKVDQMILTVLSDATISIPSNTDQTLCINTPLSDIEFTITDAGTGGIVTGSLPAGVTGTFDSGILTISGTPTEAGTFAYTVESTGNCDQQTSIEGVITVSPDNSITDAANKDQEICINTSIEDIVFTTNNTVTGAIATELPEGLTGNYSAGTFTISGTATEVGTFNYTIITSGSCESATLTGTINVLPDPTISQPTNNDQTICINTAIEPIDFIISSPATGGSADGLPTGVTGSFNNGIYSLSGVPTQVGTFEYTITSVTNCTVVSQTGELIVLPDPTADLSYSGDLCTSQAGAVSPQLNGTGEYLGGTFSASPAGLSMDTGTGDITPGTSTPGTYTIDYNKNDGCLTATASTTIILHEAPFVDIDYDDPYCTNGSLIPVMYSNGKGSYTGGEFTATPNGLMLDSATGEINTGSSSPNTYTVFYTVLAANSCEEYIAQTTVKIDQLPQATISYNTPLCTSDNTIYPVIFSSTAGDYTGGTFSSTTGLDLNSNGEINAALSSPGVYTVTYTKDIDGDGCPALEVNTQVEIFEEVSITTQPINIGICSSNPASFEVVANGDNLTYEWKREDGEPIQNATGIFTSKLSFTNATSVNAGNYFIEISGSAPCNMVTSAVVSLNVDEDIIITKPTEDITICDKEAEEITFEFVAHANNATLDFIWIKDGETLNVNNNNSKYSATVSDPVGPDGEYSGFLTIFNPNPNDTGVYAVRIIGPSSFNCPEAISKTFTFSVTELPEPPVTVNVVACLGDADIPLTATGNSLKWYTYDATTDAYTYIGDNFNHENNSTGDFSYFVTQTGDCESEYSELIITVNDKPDPLAEAPMLYEFCYEDVDKVLDITADEDNLLVWYDAVDATSPLPDTPIPNTSEVKLTSYWVAQKNNLCESERTRVDINIKPLPAINVTVDGASQICLGDIINFTASGAGSYEWFLEDDSLQTGTETTFSHQPTAAGTYQYRVVGTENGCTNTFELTIEVDESSVGGTLTGPERVCISNGTGLLELTGENGDLIKWEYKGTSTGDMWIEFTDGNLSNSRTFNIQETTTFRTTVKNGVCDEETSEHTVIVDQLPVGGMALWTKNSNRLFLTCQNPVSGYASSLEVNEYVGDISHWEYRGTSATSWSIIETTNPILTTAQIESAVSPGDETTVFRAVLTNYSCNTGVYSKSALVSVIIADIKPSPVEVDKDVICIGEEITLSSETGYSSEGGKFEGGGFDNAGIKNHGWNFTDPNGIENDFDSAADNGRPDHWLRTQPKWKFRTADIYPPYNITELWWNPLDNGKTNEHFAITQGTFSSNMETPIFSLTGMDEAILTFDQAYNLTEGAQIIVEISTNGGGTYLPENILMSVTGDGVTEIGRSGNQDRFGNGIEGINQMELDLGQFIGMANLRVRFRYTGIRDGDVWAVDNIEVPEGPQDIILQWYYDDDLNDPDNTLEEIGELNQNVVQFIPRKIGWNDFEVQTRIILDSNGDQCQSIDNFETIRVWAFDQYTTTVEATFGPCGTTTVNLNATVFATFQDMFITSYLTLDGYIGSWVILDANGNEIITGFSLENQENDNSPDPVNDPAVIFTADDPGDYTFIWRLTPTEVDENGDLIDNSGCPPLETPANVVLDDCSTLDFDGFDDYVDLGNNYNGNYFIEAWIRPFDRPLEDGSGNTDANTGVIFSSPGFEISMDNLSSKILKNGRWYHIAVSNNGALWVDGVSSGSITINTSGINNTTIGARYDANTKETSNHFSGWIEEVRIWNNAPSEKQIRFMMNQRLKLDASGTVVSPLQGEVVPNLVIPDGGLSSYHTDGTYNLDQDDETFYNLTTNDLAGYYRLYSDNPDPDNIPCFIIGNNLKPKDGNTPDHSINKVPGRLVNITTHQQNTSPTPYCSGDDGTWANVNTWARPTVWDYPNSSYNGTAIDWNIARINHDINSLSKEITMLGLLSETADKELSINPSVPLRITHYLLLNGNIDLEGESQLLQDHGSILDNASSGWLEVNQKGRMSSFNYNYWTSPVTDRGNANNSGYTLSIVLYDGDNEKLPEPVNFVNGYFSADNAKTSPITISREWIWDFRGGEADIYNEWKFMGSGFRQVVGAGYSMKGTDGIVAPNLYFQKYTFKGKPNNGNIPTNNLLGGANLSLGNNQNYLVGNPFPSAIDADQFIRDNLTNVGTGPGNNPNNENVFNGTLYYWDHFSGSTHILEEYVGGYATYTLSGSAPAISNDWRVNSTGGSGSKKPKQFIPVAQGFFLNSTTVDSDTFSGKIIFNNKQRVFKTISSHPSVFLQQEETKGEKKTNNEDTREKIRLKFESPAGYHRQILVTKDPNTTNGFDLGYDAPLIENNKEDMYWYFQDKRFVIQAVPDFEKEQVLPIAVKTSKEGNFTIKIDSMENWPVGKKVYLRDLKTDSIHDIYKSGYITSTEIGEIKDRFEIIFFKEQAQEPLPPEEITDPELPEIDGIVGISYSTFSKQVKISNFDEIKVNKVMIFDMGGKLIQQFEGFPSQKEIYLGLRPVRSGIYIVKVFCEEAICNKKIIVK